MVLHSQPKECLDSLAYFIKPIQGMNWIFWCTLVLLTCSVIWLTIHRKETFQIGGYTDVGVLYMSPVIPPDAKNYYTTLAAAISAAKTTGIRTIRVLPGEMYHRLSIFPA